MIWSLQFSNRTQACIVQADGKPVTGTMDWLAAQAIVSAHNHAIEMGKAGVAVTLAHTQSLARRQGGKQGA